jgi:holo-[acyl-carrier protein] synthase
LQPLVHNVSVGIISNLPSIEIWEEMILRTGVDLIEIARIEEVINRHGKHYLERIYTSAELEQCGKQAESLAGRFAAKEAFAKALGTGIGVVSWNEIEILGDEQNAPTLNLYGAAEQRAKEMGLSNWSVSISHSQSHAIAIVVALG